MAPSIKALLGFTSLASLSSITSAHRDLLPLVVNTWGGPFTAATDAAYLSLLASSSSSSSSSSSAAVLDAVQIGCATCERNQCDGTVGFGGSPDESCETTLDALIMDGQAIRSGAVANLRRVRDAIAVARHVLEHTQHTLLAGDQATEFALQNGFAEEDLSTAASLEMCREWRASGCQPNYRLRVSPDPLYSCGPYSPLPLVSSLSSSLSSSPSSSVSKTAGHLEPQHQQPPHDTLSLIALHRDGSMAAGTTTNGASHKIPGRVGDGSITGSGSYVDSSAGGCGATGDGDVMMRFLPCYQAVESLRRGLSPLDAAEDAVRRILRRYPRALVGVVVVSNRGEHAAAASGWTFTYSYRGGDMKETKVVTVEPLNKGPGHNVSEL